MFNMNCFILVKVLREDKNKHFFRYKNGTVLLSQKLRYQQSIMDRRAGAGDETWGQEHWLFLRGAGFSSQYPQGGSQPSLPEL